MESIGQLIIGQIVENIRFLIQYTPESLTWICIPVVFVLLLCIPYLMQYIKTIRYLSKVKKKWMPVDGRIDRITVDKKENGVVIEYSFTIDATTYQARKWKRNCKEIRTRGESTDVKVRVDPSNHYKSEINPKMSIGYSPFISAGIFLLLGYIFLYMVSGAFVAEYTNHHEMNIPAEQTETQ
jgi:hypothetical protein